MGFFDRPESDDEEDEIEESADFDAGTSPWIGGAVPMEVVLARSDEAAVVLSSVVAFPNGFDFKVHSFIHHSVKRKRHRAFGFRAWEEEELPSDYLRVGLAWPDGGRATNTGSPWPSPDETEPLHGLEEGGGGGSDREYEWNFHAWPLPEDGDLLFVVEWPGFGIPETTTPVGAAVLQEAASRARPVWEDDGDRPHRLNRWAVMARFRDAEPPS